MKGTFKFLHYATGPSMPRERLHKLLERNTQIVSIITDILFNILHKNVVPSDSSILLGLKKYKKDIYKIVGKRTRHATRAKILINNPDILTIIHPLVPSISANLKT